MRKTGDAKRAFELLNEGANWANRTGERLYECELYRLRGEEARAIIDPALRIMVDAVGRYEGSVVQSTDDGIFALFGAPAAHEDHPQRTLYAALQLQNATRTYSAKLVADGGTPLEGRLVSIPVR